MIIDWLIGGCHKLSALPHFPTCNMIIYLGLHKYKSLKCILNLEKCRSLTNWLYFDFLKKLSFNFRAEAAISYAKSGVTGRSVLYDHGYGYGYNTRSSLCGPLDTDVVTEVKTTYYDKVSIHVINKKTHFYVFFVKFSYHGSSLFQSLLPSVWILF